MWHSFLLVHQDKSKVKQLELELLETRMLYTTTLENYDVVSINLEMPSCH